MKELVPSMVDSHGEAQHDRQSIADIFAVFYKHLYKDESKSRQDHDEHQDNDDDNHNGSGQVPPFTMAELCKALRQLKRIRLQIGTVL